MPNNAYDDVMSGTRDNNIKFLYLRYVMESRGFFCRIKGDHYIYYRSDIPDIVNIQPNGKMAKPYQVRQIRRLFVTYNI